MRFVRACARWAPPIVVASMVVVAIVREELRGEAPADDCPLGAAFDVPAVDLCVATAEELEGLPRIGPALAARIVADRNARGPFRGIDDLRRVRGIGAATVAELAGRVTAQRCAERRRHEGGQPTPADAGAWQRE